MTQHNTLNLRLSYPHLNNLKSGIKNGAEETLNIVGHSSNKNNFPH